MATRSPQGRYLLLGLLDLEDQSGYDLKQAIEQSVGHFWREGYGQIYPALEQLEQAGLVESHVERQSGRPDRKVYALLEMGREWLREWLKEPARDQVPRNELLLKLFFGRLMSKATLRAHLTSKRDRLLEELRVYRALHARLDHESARRKELPYWLLTLRYGEHITKAELAWCNEALKQFDGEIT
jgi:PadR family transcriptional regulator AphA